MFRPHKEVKSALIAPMTLTYYMISRTSGNSYTETVSIYSLVNNYWWYDKSIRYLMPGWHFMQCFLQRTLCHLLHQGFCPYAWWGGMMRTMQMSSCSVGLGGQSELKTKPWTVTVGSSLLLLRRNVSVWLFRTEMRREASTPKH